ncbi:hypothetical protein DH2020_041109 [Rehmannia glutinosa]|uniref:DUF4005 domain-containing protein n=1 Tax=Rehmannia glutinosa TaxID=99300 RepID=A0ABR0URT0_REHGL
MGKASRWFRGLLGMKKDKENVEINSNCGEKKEKKRWSFAKSGKDSGGLTQIPANIPASDSDWLRSYIADSEKEQNKHAIAVAAATAAAADAAVAAAQAAVAVVRLTSQGKGGLFTGGREKLAAVKIQTFFRGYLARKALRALKGLVKLQALVRGYLVRKRAAATLHSMQALFRAQAGVRAQRARRSISNDYRFQPEIRARKSIAQIKVPENQHLYVRVRRRSLLPSDIVAPPVSRPARLSIPDCRHLQDYDWGFVTDDYKFATAQNTPRFDCSGRAYGPVTPAKSVCGDGYFRPYSNCPNYMTNTQSFRAKLRSHSAPRQRPELGPKKRLSLNDVMASRTSFSGVRMQRTSCSQAQEDFEI